MFIGAIRRQAGVGEVRSITAVVACAGVPLLIDADPPLYRILPGRYCVAEPLSTPLAPTEVHAWLVTSRVNDTSSDGPMVKVFPFGVRKVNGYSSSCTAEVFTLDSSVQVSVRGA